MIHYSHYKPPIPFTNKHFNTIYTNLWRKHFLQVTYERNRIATTDEDFLDLDFSSTGSKSAVLLIHGLEGHAYSPYMKGMVQAVNQAGADAVSLNLRGCSGAMNQQPVTYHSGKTEDVYEAIRYLLNQNLYKELYLTGFSLGGNLVLKLAGEQGQALDKRIKGLAAVSIPFDLHEVALNMDKLSNRIYRHRFLKTLKQKAVQKFEQFPGLSLNAGIIRKARNFHQFDNAFTAPLNGFRDAVDYWEKCSCKNFLSRIDRPAFMINAMDDPFIPADCIPHQEIKRNPNLTLLTPKHGGHVGFGKWGLRNHLWHEQFIIRALRLQKC